MKAADDCRLAAAAVLDGLIEDWSVPAFVRGRRKSPRYRARAAGGATGWSYRDVLPYFCKSEGLAASDEIVIDGPRTGGRDGFGSRRRLLPRELREGRRRT